MPTRRQIAVAGVALAGVAAVAAARRGVPPPERVRTFAGVREPIEIRRDEVGIPHIRANSLADVMFGLGYAMAEDRLWQMDILHRVGMGRLADAIGEPGLDTDKFMLTLGVRRASTAAARLLGDTKIALDGFAAGVNAYIASSRPLPEFLFARYGPLAWTPAASIASMKLMGWSLNGYLDKMLLHDRVAGAVGEAWAALVMTGDDSVATDAVVSGGTFGALRERMEGVQETVRGLTGLGGEQPGSNNWVVSGAHTASGKPLLANDPHLAFQLPSIWYECHLTAPRLNAAGATIVGLPGIAIGHNDHAAWGITASMQVQCDVYVEEFETDPNRRLSYRVGDEWAEVERFVDVIPVKGRRDAEAHETLVTRHGPVISGLGDAKGESRALALRWVGQESWDEISGFLDFMTADTADEFRAACAEIGNPSLNLVFADDAGHIGYQYVGRIPIRPEGCGVRPLPGRWGEYDWRGYVPFAETPHLTDPPEGWIVTANTRIPPADYPYPLPSVYVAPYRLRRIRQLLDGRDGLTLEEMRRIQADVYDLHAEPLRPLVLATLDGADRPWSASESLALELLRAWDGHADADSAGAAIWNVFYQRWMRRVLQTRQSDDLTDAVMSTFLGAAHWVLPDRLLHSDDLGWFTDATREATLLACFADGVAWLTETLGPYPAEWEWGKIHTVTFKHPIAQGAKRLGPILNIGPHPVGGDCNTVNNAYWGLKEPFAVRNGASFRLLVDLAKPTADDGALACNITGESGRIRSRHYADQTPPWLRVRFHPLGTNADAVAARAPRILRLLPESSDFRVPSSE